MFPVASKSTSSTSPDWSRLPDEIWILIWGKLLLEDNMRCRNVCKSWLSRVRNLKHCSSLPRPPWLMVSESSSVFKFFDMARNKVHKIHCPELRDRAVLGSSEGWLIVADKKTADLQLVNSFTKVQIHLPPTTTFPGIVRASHDSQGRVKQYGIQMGPGTKNIVSENPAYVWQFYYGGAILASSSRGYTVVVKYRDDYGLACARAGDQEWTDLQSFPGQLKTGMFFKGLFYAMDVHGRLLTFDLSSNINPPSPQQVATPFPGFSIGTKNIGMLPGSGGILFLERTLFRCGRLFRSRINTSVLDHDSTEWVDADDVGGHSVFLTKDHGPLRNMVCLAAKDRPEPIKVGDCIYIVVDGSLKEWDIEGQNMKDYCWTAEIGSEVGHLLLHGGVWIDPVLSSLSL